MSAIGGVSIALDCVMMPVVAPSETFAAIKRKVATGWKPVLRSSTYLGANTSRVDLPARRIAPHGNCSVQFGDQFAANLELDCGVLEVVANRLATSAEMSRQECFRNGREGAAVFGPAEAVALITIVDIGHGDAVLLHCRDDLLGFGGFDAHVVRALADQ
jgi:hypothetical protein